jgi:membrane protease YdiL (CAAX protease family)
MQDMTGIGTAKFRQARGCGLARDKMQVKWAIIPLVFVLIAAFQDPLYALSGLTSVPHGWPIFFFGYGILLPIVIMTLIDGHSSRIIGELGLSKNPLPAILFALIATSPALIGFALKAQINPALKSADIVWGGLFFPFVEETFFRGFLFGQLYQRAQWGFWPAALTPAVVFAAAHFYQSQDPAEIAGILAITGLGAVVFSFVFMQWGANIWAPFACHAALNILWTVFAVDDTALGDYYANAVRAASIVLALGLCFAGARFGWLKPLTRAERTV